MYSFDGQHKSSPNISLGGSSKKVSKSSLLQSARQERLKRESIRKQINAAIKLQAWLRGCYTRRQLAEHKRLEYDKRLEHVKRNETDLDQLTHLAQQINVFYNFNEDYKRLVTLCQIFLKLASTKKLHNLFGTCLPDWLHRIKNLLVLCCRSLHKTSETNISIPLRMLEVFTEARTYAWLNEKTAASLASSITICIIQKGYFRDLRDLVKQRVPSSIEPSEIPPTPFAAAARDLVIKPLSNNTSAENTRITLSALIRDILSPSMTEPICFFLVPAISKSISITSFMESIMITENQCSVWTLYSLLIFCKNKLSTASTDQLMLFVNCLKKLINRLQSKKENTSLVKYDSDESDDSDMELDQSEDFKQPVDLCLQYVQEKCLEILNEKEASNAILYLIDQSHGNKSDYSNCIEAVCYIVHHLLTSLHLQVHKNRLLYSLAFNRKLLNACWCIIQTMEMKTNSGKKVKMMERLMYGFALVQQDEWRIVSMLSCFTILFRYALFSIYDSDFYSEGTAGRVSMMPFTLTQLVEMSHLLRELVIGLITLIYPDIKSIRDEGKWSSLCLNVTQLLKQLYARDTRHQFCPDNHWLSERASFNQEILNISSFLEEDDTRDLGTSNNSTRDSRCLAILKYIPFAVPFLQRVRIFHKILSEDLKRSRNMEQAVLPSHGMNISVNRKYLYQDAYDQLSQDRAPDIRKVIRVHMINAHGLDEAGIDGGGVFREFMTQLLKTGFDPSYGFFKLTSQQQLYPNPDIDRIQPDYLKHLHFLGRMLGKIIYESMMVELPLADFFLCKLLNKHGADVDIYHLESLDPELYKNLLSLKNYDGDVDDLALNFTVVRSDYGETRVEELKPGGKDICVTNNNRIEYIHLMADYRLNKQIRAHCNAFRAGLSDVINIEWLQMFDHRELQILISGAQVPVDIDDMRSNTNYSGLYSAEDEYIEAFWKIVMNLTDKQKRQFLKFVTSCSRPPLLGFSELYPQFCIHYGGEEDRLPTASTCMNLLKLPKYQNTELLKAKLIYAIEAEAGFELS